jgi:hypothetical protein
MAVIVVIPDGTDWFKANWLCRQISQHTKGTRAWPYLGECSQIRKNCAPGGGHSNFQSRSKAQTSPAKYSTVAIETQRNGAWNQNTRAKTT